MKINEFENKAKEALLQCLQDVPFLEVLNVEVQPSRNKPEPDIRIEVKDQEKVRYVIGELKNSGEPRYAREAVNQISRYRQELGSDYGVFVAPYISSGSAAICEDENIGTLDLAGNCRISFGNIYIHKEGKANPFTRKRYLRSLFSPKAERVLRVMLASSPKVWKTEELAREAEVSVGQVANVKKLLADQEWIDGKPVGFSLSDPLALLEEWSQNYAYRRNEVMNYYTLLEIPEFEYRLGEVCGGENIRYGLTGFSGSARYAPAVRYQRATAYIQSELDELQEALGIKLVESGANVMLLKPYDEGVFYGTREREGTLVVSAIQTYLDLVSYRGRGEEAAEQLLDRVIKPAW